MTLRSVRIAAGVSGAELAEKLKPMFPRVNKQVISYAEDPANTGVTLTAAMKREVEVQTGQKFNSKDQGRKDGARLSVWLPASVRDEFNALKKENSLTTDKEMVIRLIKNAAQSAATDKDGCAVNTRVV